MEESALILAIYGLNFLSKIQFLSFSRNKTPKFSPVWHFFLVFFMKCSSNCPICRKTPCPDKFLLIHLYEMTCLWTAVQKNWFTTSLVEHLKMLNVSILNFIILNPVNKGILDFHVTTTADICMKEVIESCLRRELWRKIMEVLKVFPDGMEASQVHLRGVWYRQKRADLQILRHLLGDWLKASYTSLESLRFPQRHQLQWIASEDVTLGLQTKASFGYLFI